MAELSRRAVLAALAAAGAVPADAQTPPVPPVPADPPPERPATPPFGYDMVIDRARALASAPFAPVPPLPAEIAGIDFETWRDIRFRPERSFFATPGSPFRLQLFHLGYLYTQPVTVDTIRDGIPTPIPYAPNLFDYGRTKFDKPLPVNLGFGGFRLHYPINDPRVFDEVIAFLGASYFRFLGRGQRYGASARALAINAGTHEEEFPFFREFWIETAQPNANRATIYGLLDSASVTGAFRFDLYPGVSSVLEVQVNLYPRKAGIKIGLAPLTSMFFVGENDHRFTGDFRPELHDSDGLLVHSGTGEWIWRPLRNPPQMEVSAFLDRTVRGFGLMQRDRIFEHYQDLDLAYEKRPTYWVEPRRGWTEGRVELVELPTPDETNDNIVAYWVPDAPVEIGKPISLSYTITASLDADALSPNGAPSTRIRPRRGPWDRPKWRRPVRIASSSILPAAISATSSPIRRRSKSSPLPRPERFCGSFLVPNAHTGGFRAGIDIQLDPGQSTDLRAFLRAGSRALTETWTTPWRTA